MRQLSAAPASRPTTVGECDRRCARTAYLDRDRRRQAQGEAGSRKLRGPCVRDAKTVAATTTSVIDEPDAIRPPQAGQNQHRHCQIAEGCETARASSISPQTRNRKTIDQLRRVSPARTYAHPNSQLPPIGCTAQTYRAHRNANSRTAPTRGITRCIVSASNSVRSAL